MTAKNKSIRSWCLQI